jgi:hypothetical protein
MTAAERRNLRAAYDWCRAQGRSRCAVGRMEVRFDFAAGVGFLHSGAPERLCRWEMFTWRADKRQTVDEDHRRAVECACALGAGKYGSALGGAVDACRALYAEGEALKREWRREYDHLFEAEGVA